MLQRQCGLRRGQTESWLNAMKTQLPPWDTTCAETMDRYKSVLDNEDSR